MRMTWMILAIVAVVAAALLGLRMARATGAGTTVATGEAGGSLWDLETRTLDGDPVALARYAGQVALVVNTASKCGLTPQYEGLEALYRELEPRGFVVLGFPSNDFLNQEPGTPAEIRRFCTTNYDVTFPLFAKIPVTGEGRDPIYRFLTRELEVPTWNFTKYLVGRDGRVLARFGPRTKPDDAGLRARIETALAASEPAGAR